MLLQKTKSTLRAVVVLLLFLGIKSPLSAKITLGSIFTDNMVLQQQTYAPIWGKAAPGKTVTLLTSWDNKTYKTTANEKGDWSIPVQTPAAGFTPYSIRISDGKPVTLNNVLIGEVWICSGQSNMEMPLAGWGQIDNYEKEIADANYPDIRLLHVAKTTSDYPLEDAKLENGGWTPCSSASIPNFSSVAYFFGRDLLQHVKVPIGLINVTWGGTIAEAWTSAGSLQLMPDFRDALPAKPQLSNEEQEQLFKTKMAEWQKKTMQTDRGYKGTVANWASPALDDNNWKSAQVPGVWSNNEQLKKFDGIAWFRKTISIPASWKGKDLKLSLGGIDDNDVTYFNGVQVGASNGWNVSRVYVVPARLVKEGKAVITVRVNDESGNGGIYGDAATLNIGPIGEQSVALGGVWKYEIGADVKELPLAPQSVSNNPNRPTVLFNAMIQPLVPFAIRGAIWYQGESNAERAYQYRDLFPLMITDWRKQWNNRFPFYFVQLANYKKTDKNPQESAWAELREAQMKTLSLDNTGMAVTIDIGDANDIHPKNKQDVGLRLALQARANTYGEKVVFSGPLYQSYKVEDKAIRIAFSHTAGGLQTKDGRSLVGFAIAGADHVFRWAEATIEGDEVVVSSPQVDFPVAVRYAWANNPQCNLCNGAGLPASPFRTDDWPGVTSKNK